MFSVLYLKIFFENGNKKIEILYLIRLHTNSFETALSLSKCPTRYQHGFEHSKNTLGNARLNLESLPETFAREPPTPHRCDHKRVHTHKNAAFGGGTTSTLCSQPPPSTGPRRTGPRYVRVIVVVVVAYDIYCVRACVRPRRRSASEADATRGQQSLARAHVLYAYHAVAAVYRLARSAAADMSSRGKRSTRGETRIYCDALTDVRPPGGFMRAPDV